MSTIAPWAFVLAVPDLQRSAGYFRDMLGFRVLWEEATDWRLVERDGVRIMLDIVRTICRLPSSVLIAGSAISTSTIWTHCMPS